MDADRHDDAIGERAGAADDIDMAVGQRIE
jgi:hypothetical protein